MFFLGVSSIDQRNTFVARQAVLWHRVLEQAIVPEAQRGRKTVEEKLMALRKMFHLADRYVGGGLEFREFFSALNELLGLFDPLDWSIEDLPDESKAAVIFFSKWGGGEFGEAEHHIPKNPNWRYGDDTEKFHGLIKIASCSSFA